MRRPSAWTITLLILMSGCARTDSDHSKAPTVATDSGVLDVYVVNYPLKYFAERIGGDHVRVTFPAPSDEDPAFWRPDADAISAYQQADLILLNGATYAKWIQTVTLPESRMVDTSVSLWKRYIRITDAVTHSHGPGKEHAHAGLAFTTWLDPEFAIAQADAIQRALAKARPQHASDFEQGLESLLGDFKELDQQIAKAIDGRRDQPLVFSHPVYQYLARHYGLNARSVHWEPDSVPSPKMRDELAILLETHPAKVMIWEGEPIAENAKLLDKLGLRNVVFDPCGNVPEGDFMSVMKQNAANLADALSK